MGTKRLLHPFHQDIPLWVQEQENGRFRLPMRNTASAARMKQGAAIRPIA